MFKKLINKLKLHRNGYIEIDLNNIRINYLINEENKLYEFCGFPVISYRKWGRNYELMNYFIIYNLKQKRILEFRVPNWDDLNKWGKPNIFKNLKFIKNVSNFKDLLSLENELLNIIKNKNLERFDKHLEHFENEVKKIYTYCSNSNFYTEKMHDKLFSDDSLIRIAYDDYGKISTHIPDGKFTFNDLNILIDNFKKLKCICIDNLSYLYEKFPELLINDNLNEN